MTAETQPQRTAGQATAKSPIGRSDLPTLTSVRAFAALAVFFCHLSLGKSNIFLKPFDYGYLGVSYFFVLSGFVLTWSLKPEASVGNFFLRRFARVYPAHLVAFATAAVFIAAGARSWPGLPALVSNLLLVQAWSPDSATVFAFNSPSWSLSCEMAFYAVFPAVIYGATRIRLRSMWILVAAAVGTYITAATLLSLFGGSQISAVVLYANPLIRLPQFLIGVAVGKSVMAGWRIPPWMLWGALVASLAGIGLAPHQPAPDAWATLAAAASIALFAQRDIAVASPRWLISKPLQYAGRVSFCFYLVHQMAIEICGRFIENTGYAAMLSLFMACLAAVALHHGVENPCNRWILGHRRGRLIEGAA